MPPNFIQNQQDQGVHQETQNNSNNNSKETDEGNQFIVNRILKVRKRNGKPEFYIKWAGYRERTWGPEEHIPTELIRHSMQLRHRKAHTENDQSKIQSLF